MPNQSLLIHGPRAGLLAAAGHDAHRPRAVRRPDLRDARRGRLPQPRDRALAGEVLHHQRALAAEDRRRLLAFARDLLNSDYAGHRLTFQLFAQSPPFAHLARSTATFDFDGPLRFVQRVGRAVRAGAGRERRGMTHTRIRPFNTRDTYPEQQLDNDLCQAVVAGDTIYLRGQVGQDLDTARDVAVGDPAAQAEQAMDNIELLLGECGGGARGHLQGDRVPDRHPLPRAGLPGAGPAAARRLPGLHRPRGGGAGPARVAGRGRRDGRHRGSRRRDLLAGRALRRAPACWAWSCRSSSPAVAARCAHVRAGSARPPPRTSPTRGWARELLDLMRGGLAGRPRRWRGCRRRAAHRLPPADRGRRDRRHRRLLGRAARWARTPRSQGPTPSLPATCWPSAGVPEAMLAAFAAIAGGAPGRPAAGRPRGRRWQAGGEAGPVRSAGLLVGDREAWPVVDLRVDWHDEPVDRAGAVWEVWKPQMDAT